MGSIIFILLVRYHQKIARLKTHYGLLRQINEKEIQRLQGKFHHFEADGSHFAEPLHPYTSDLDIFGKNSLYQYLNRTTTPAGSTILAGWLQKKATPGQIRQRQEAVTELAQKQPWLQDFEATGLYYPKQTEDLNKLWQWLEAPSAFPEAASLRIAAVVLPVLTAAVFTVYFLTDTPFIIPGILLLINGWVIQRCFRRVTGAVESTYQNLPTLRAISELIQKVENEPMQTPMLTAITNTLALQGKAALKIHQLAAIVRNLEMRNNVYFSIIANGFFLWDVQWVLRLEKWRATHRSELRKWVEAIGELEALCSLAGFRFAHPDYAMPEIAAGSFQYVAQRLGHPLIHPVKRVSNDFEIRGEGTTMVITGSNMSGKSTFLRTVGINAVLAFSGAPVCAERLVISPVQVFSGMRTQDSLSESVSSFYAELKRIRQLLTEVEAQVPVFYLLDEILKGTNSQDRHNGAKALVRQLAQTRSSGLISTHDLELGSLEGEMPGRVVNYNFSSDLHGDQLIFDYTLKKGICRSFNASTLMQQMGIKMK